MTTSLKYHIITLGCPKNAVDSEGMSSILDAQGHAPVAAAEAADVIIVNTCSFIAAARDETLGVLKELAAAKRPQQRLVAAGCMAESHADLLRRRVAGIDATVSTREWMRIGQVLGDLMAPAAELIPLEAQPGARQVSNGAAELIPLEVLPVARQVSNGAAELIPLEARLGAQQASNGAAELIPHTTGAGIPIIGVGSKLAGLPDPNSRAAGDASGYADWRSQPIRRRAAGSSAYLKISDGCNLRCAFCTIPSFKGDMRSKAMGAILGEAQELVAQGVREIVLVAQHLTDYGRDLGLKHGLATLLDELCQLIPPDRWLRLMYAYPSSVTPQLIESMARNHQVRAYLDMPLQHAHPETLRRMRRPPDTQRTLATIRALREAMPDLALRSTFIVGFPGETRAEFAALLAFLEEVQFDRAGAFRYSREPGTPAAELAGQLPAAAIEKRWHQFMALQQQISRTRNARWLGRQLDVLIEGSGTTADGQTVSVGRSFRDAPEVDGQVFVWGELPVGLITPVRVTQALEYDLWAERVD